MKEVIKNRKIILGLLTVIGISLSSAVFALQTTWPSSPTGIQLTDNSDLTDLVQYLYEWGITLGGLAVFIALIIAGVQYLGSVGDPGAMREAKGRIISAGIGLALLLGSWLILNTINPELTTLQPPPYVYEDLEMGTTTPAEQSWGKPCPIVNVFVYAEETPETPRIDFWLAPHNCFDPDDARGWQRSWGDDIDSGMEVTAIPYIDYDEAGINEWREEYINRTGEEPEEIPCYEEDGELPVPCDEGSSRKYVKIDFDGKHTPNYKEDDFCVGDVVLYDDDDCDTVLTLVPMSGDRVSPHKGGDSIRLTVPHYPEYEY